MIISNKRKWEMVLCCLALMQFSLQGMTENQARGLAVLAGGCSAAFVARCSDDSRAVLGALVLPGVYAYYYLQRHTSGTVLHQMENSVTGMTDDPLASGYKINFTSKNCDNDKFVKKIGKCISYQTEEKHSLIMAKEKLHAFQKIILAMGGQLVKIHESAQKDGHGEKWEKLDRQIAEYGENIKKAIARIERLPKYQEVKWQYDQAQNTREQQEIDKQNANTKSKKVKLKEKEVNIKKQNAESVRSWVSLKWIKWICSWFSFRTKE